MFLVPRILFNQVLYVFCLKPIHYNLYSLKVESFVNLQGRGLQKVVFPFLLVLGNFL